MYEYGNENRKPSIGFVEDSFRFKEQREKIYNELLGNDAVVSHELLPLVPHIDVYEYRPNEDRPFYTYITCGMSDLPMNIPSDLDREYRRIELVFYSETSNEDYADLLRFFAHFVHNNKTWLHWHHTMPNGNPPQPVFGTTNLDTFLFAPTMIEADSMIADKLSLDGDTVNLVWVIPITTAECELKLQKGVDAVYDLFGQFEHPIAFDGDRESYV